jgi:hypothetical protein
MRPRQTCIATFEAKPGTRLARPIIKVFNQRPFQLLAGTELTEDHIRQIVVGGIHPTEITKKFWGHSIDVGTAAKVTRVDAGISSTRVGTSIKRSRIRFHLFGQT